LQILPSLTEISTGILFKENAGKQTESLKELKEHIALLYLKEEFSVENLRSLLFPAKLKGLVLKHCDDYKECGKVCILL